MKVRGIDIDFEQYALKYDVVLYTIETIRKEYKNEYIAKSEPRSFIRLATSQKDKNAIEDKKTADFEKFWPCPLRCYLWKKSAALFAFFVWSVSMECYKRGFNIFKSIGKEQTDNVCDIQRFRYFFPVGYEIADFENKATAQNREIDRKTMQMIKPSIQPHRPKGADKLEKIIKDTLQKFFIE